MYMRITPGRVDPAKIDDEFSQLQLAQDIVRGLPGCQSYVEGRNDGKSN